MKPITAKDLVSIFPYTSKIARLLKFRKILITNNHKACNAEATYKQMNIIGYFFEDGGTLTLFDKVTIEDIQKLANVNIIDLLGKYVDYLELGETLIKLSVDENHNTKVVVAINEHPNYEIQIIVYYGKVRIYMYANTTLNQFKNIKKYIILYEDGVIDNR